MTRLSRPCYDKPWRCPGWAGGGMNYAEINRCPDGGLLPDIGVGPSRWWTWRMARCPECGVLVLPYLARWLDWRWLTYRIRRRWRR